MAISAVTNSQCNIVRFRVSVGPEKKFNVKDNECEQNMFRFFSMDIYTGP